MIAWHNCRTMRYGRTRTWNTGVVHRRHRYVGNDIVGTVDLDELVTACVGISFAICMIWGVVCLIQGPGDNYCGPAKWPMGGLAMLCFPVICLVYQLSVHRCNDFASANNCMDGATSRVGMTFEQLFPVR